MTNFVKFSDVRKKRTQMEQLEKEGMSDVKGGALPIYVMYGINCIISLYSVSMYSVTPVDVEE